ncbi:DUF4437 domain-containing protein [Nocardia sp. CDC159]|uniref:DUF4437 domain-containing protein n=1 Tax=Nocardia pulmonis TaxID=2951408 RepID=A0A9X2IX45_9NOCA|nr:MULTISPECIES: DUF4437 domain-containing protein [Nocardia]MCM6772526.1 DUF4437 domain-containing protein [Nocardia pulmonis]MCM6784816.1 DUF4437 domain-containing protein [Nocardia sp. CDC159]
MRPHVELIDERDLIWHVAEFELATGSAEQRNLSYDEEDGSASLKVRFTSDWSRPAGVHDADTEWFVLSGRVTIGDTELGPEGFWTAPKGVWTPPISVAERTEILLFREHGGWHFERADAGRDFVREDQKLVVLDAAAMPWIDVKDGSPMRFDLGGTPVPGLYIKLLHRDQKTGFYTRLIKAKPGWREEPLAHHPCSEEAYCLAGGFDYNYGKMWPGTYFWRPALIRHGDFTADAEQGCTWIVRSDADLVDWYTDNPKVVMSGQPTNWGPEFPNTLAPKLVEPVRSRSIGPWADPTYQ